MGYNDAFDRARPFTQPAGDNPDPLTIRRIELAENWQEQEREMERRRLASLHKPPAPPAPPTITMAGISLALSVAALVITLFVVGVL